MNVREVWFEGDDNPREILCNQIWFDVVEHKNYVEPEHVSVGSSENL